MKTTKRTDLGKSLGRFAAIFTCLAAGSVGAATITAYYDFEGTGADRFDDPAGAFADDLDGQFNPVFSADTPGALSGSQSASFNGNSALFTDAYSTDLGPDPNAMTIMFWVKGEDILQENDNTRLMTARVNPDGSSAGNLSFQVEGFGNDGKRGVRMDMRALNGVDNMFAPDARSGSVGALANTGQTVEWHHVAFVWANSGDPGDGGAYAQTYFDGVSVGIHSEHSSWDGLNIANPSGQLILGGHAENAGNRAFTGLLDDVALFAGVVDASDIAAIAAGNLSPAAFIPEPSSALLSTLGLSLLFRRRRRS